MKKIIECVPNFSEGRDERIIQAIANAIRNVEGVKLLHIDAGKAANRTVMTFAGAPEAVVEAAYRGIQKAAELIDMRSQTGEHPRIGATDVCPLIPISGVTMEETIEWSKKLSEKVGKGPLSISTFLYENSASKPERRNLATIRSGEYEGLKYKLTLPDWQPDYGPSEFNPRTGATVIGARDFLIAYNVNLNTKDVNIAKKIAQMVRESGYIVTLPNGEKQRQAGLLKSVKAIGWYIEEFGCAQVSMNLTDINVTSVHQAFEACSEIAQKLGAKVTGSELIGLMPKRVMMEAGLYFLRKKNQDISVPETAIIEAGVIGLGLSDLSFFEPRERIIEYLLEGISISVFPILKRHNRQI
jgi:glutamate formiminotransferase / formiminotetrahydrofolate cyclodeaminase